MSETAAFYQVSCEGKHSWGLVTVTNYSSDSVNADPPKEFWQCLRCGLTMTPEEHNNYNNKKNI